MQVLLLPLVATQPDLCPLISSSDSSSMDCQALSTVQRPL